MGVGWGWKAIILTRMIILNITMIILIILTWDSIILIIIICGDSNLLNEEEKNPKQAIIKVAIFTTTKNI
jgi:hypothetical protein